MKLPIRFRVRNVYKARKGETQEQGDENGKIIEKFTRFNDLSLFKLNVHSPSEFAKLIPFSSEA